MSAKQQGIPTYIKPDSICGWRDGESFDVSASRVDGFFYPKSQRRYETVFGIMPETADYGVDRDMTELVQANAKAIFDHANEVYNSMIDNKRLDEPILVYALGDKIHLINGALRLSCIAQIRKSYPEAFDLVPAIFFDGSPQEAKQQMIMIHSRDRSRALTLLEQVRSVAYMIANGINQNDIAEHMGWRLKPWYVQAMIGLSRLPDEELTTMDQIIAGKVEKPKKARQGKNATSPKKIKDYLYYLRYGLEIYEGKKKAPIVRKKKVDPFSKIFSKSKKASKEISDLMNELAMRPDIPDGNKMIESLTLMAERFNDFGIILRQLRIRH